MPGRLTARPSLARLAGEDGRGADSPGARPIGRAQDQRVLGAALLGFATLLVLASYAAICVQAGSVWPWHEVVHEDGRRTLLETVLFYEHAARELPLDLLLGLMIGGSALLATAPGPQRGGARSSETVTLSLLLGAAVALIILGAVAEVGPSGLADNLLQKPTRAGAPLVLGAHWHYHLLSRLALLLVAFGFAGVLRWRSGIGPDACDRTGLGVILVALASFCLLTVVFTPDASMLSPPFTEPRHLGHQAREALTHGLVTLPIAFGCCLLLGDRRRRVPLGPAAGRPYGGLVRAWIPCAIVLGAGGMIIAAWLGLAAIASDSVAHGQTADLGTLVFPHVFEHAFTYLVVTLVAGLVLRCAPGHRTG